MWGPNQGSCCRASIQRNLTGVDEQHTMRQMWLFDFDMSFTLLYDLYACSQDLFLQLSPCTLLVTFNNNHFLRKFYHCLFLARHILSGYLHLGFCLLSIRTDFDAF